MPFSVPSKLTPQRCRAALLLQWPSLPASALSTASSPRPLLSATRRPWVIPWRYCSCGPNYCKHLPHIARVAERVLAQPVSASAAERNWSIHYWRQS
eukprot:6103288-Pleurochrysis_carterae.AAC.1